MFLKDSNDQNIYRNETYKKKKRINPNICFWKVHDLWYQLTSED